MTMRLKTIATQTGESGKEVGDDDKKRRESPGKQESRGKRGVDDDIEEIARQTGELGKEVRDDRRD